MLSTRGRSNLLATAVLAAAGLAVTTIVAMVLVLIALSTTLAVTVGAGVEQLRSSHVLSHGVFAGAAMMHETIMLNGFLQVSWGQWTATTARKKKAVMTRRLLVLGRLTQTNLEADH